MAYKKVGVIKSISDAPINKNIIVNGHVNKNGWMWHMDGFRKGLGRLNLTRQDK